MNQHEHDHKHHDQHHGHKKKRLHQDWRTWLVVMLMLAAMAAYLLSMDESLQPGGQGQKMPAEAAP